MKSLNKKVGVYMCICEEDAYRLDVILPEIDRLGFDVAWYADKCSDKTVEKIKSNKHTVFAHRGEGDFNEFCRQFPFDFLKREGYEWAFNWDTDETWNKTARGSILRFIEEHPDEPNGVCRMKTVWKVGDKRYFRRDGLCNEEENQSNTRRMRLFNLKYDWMWMNGTNNSPAYGGGKGYSSLDTSPVCDAVTIHWGYETKELRDMHKERWDKIYTKVSGKQPYGNWVWFCDETIEPLLEEFTDDNIENFHYLTNHIEGWMSDEELQWLYKTAQKMDSILEIGSWLGRSTHALLRGCRGLVTAVDHFEGTNHLSDTTRGTGVKLKIYERFQYNMKAFDNLEILKMSSKEAKKLVGDRKFDMIFIDGNHGDEEFKKDLEMWKGSATKILCGHDYKPLIWGGLVRAVDELRKDGLVGSIWYKGM